MAGPRLRRTKGIVRGDDSPTSLGHDIALRENPPEEIAAARRLIERTATGPDDQDQLLDALGLGRHINRTAPAGGTRS